MKISASHQKIIILVLKQINVTQDRLVIKYEDISLLQFSDTHGEFLLNLRYEIFDAEAESIKTNEDKMESLVSDIQKVRRVDMLLVFLQTVCPIFVYAILDVDTTLAVTRLLSICHFDVRLSFFANVFINLKLRTDPSSYLIIILLKNCHSFSNITGSFA